MTGRISRIGDHGVRVAIYEAANVILTRAVRGSDLKNWALRVAQRAGMKKAEVALARKLAVVLHRMLTDSTTFVVRQQGFGRARHQPRPDGLGGQVTAAALSGGSHTSITVAITRKILLVQGCPPCLTRQTWAWTPGAAPLRYNQG